MTLVITLCYSNSVTIIQRYCECTKCRGNGNLEKLTIMTTNSSVFFLPGSKPIAGKVLKGKSAGIFTNVLPVIF